DPRRKVLEFCADRLHVSEGDQGGYEAHELLIERLRIAMDHADRVGHAARFEVALAPHPVEGGANAVESFSFRRSHGFAYRSAVEDRLKALEEFTLADLEAVRLILRGDSVIDWHRLNFTDEQEVHEFIVSQEFRPDLPSDRARLEQIKTEAIAYLRRNFD